MFYIIFIPSFCILTLVIWSQLDRKYQSNTTVANAYDVWTNDGILEKLWGEHVHLGFYQASRKKRDFRAAKVDFVHQLVEWSALSSLPKGSRILDVGCGIGGSSRILAETYDFDVLGISISPEQINRARQLTSTKTLCSFQVMDALDLKFENGSFDAVWSVEAGPHMPDKQLYANEMLRVLRPGGVLVVADWNKRDTTKNDFNLVEKIIIKQLLNQWSHPDFSSIEGFKSNIKNSPFCGGNIEIADWTEYTLPSWIDSIMEGIRRPKVFLSLGPLSLFKSIREIPTILLMHFAFSKGMMQFGVFKCRG